MKKERFKSSHFLTYLGTAAMAAIALLGDVNHRSIHDIILYCPLGLAAVLIVYLGELTTFVEIEDDRHIINSGYSGFIRKDKFDIIDIKYIYRHPEFILKQYGSRLVFYIKMPDGRLRQSALREQAYSNDTIVAMLKRLKQIKPSIELDPEYEKIIAGQMFTDDMSQNTVSSVEARLKAKGERW